MSNLAIFSPTPVREGKKRKLPGGANRSERWANSSTEDRMVCDFRADLTCGATADQLRQQRFEGNSLVLHAVSHIRDRVAHVVRNAIVRSAVLAIFLGDQARCGTLTKVPR